MGEEVRDLERVQLEAPTPAVGATKPDVARLVDLRGVVKPRSLMAQTLIGWSGAVASKRSWRRWAYIG